MRAIDTTAVVTVALGVTMVVFWTLGWEVLALTAFLAGGVQRLSLIGYRTARISKGVTGDPSLHEASIAYAQDRERGRFLAHFGLVRLSEAAAWPAIVVLNSSLGAVIGLLTPDHIKMRRERALNYVAFCCPPALLSLAAHGFQAWFLATQFSMETHAGLAFKATVTIQISGFAALGLHFFARRNFMKNFSGAGIPPFLFVAATSVLAVGAAAQMRILAATAFGGGAPTVNGEALFQAARALVLNEGLFDLIEVLRSSETWAEFSSEISAAAARITWLGSLDAFLSAFVVLAPVRALWSSITLKRDDEDRRSRAWYFLSAGRTEQALAEADKMESTGEAASVMALAALCAGNYEAFVSNLELVDGSASLTAAGRDPDALRHIHFIQALAIAPTDPAHFSGMLEALWLERGRLASALFLSSWLAELHGGRAALDTHAQGRAWGEAVNGVFAFIDKRLSTGDSFTPAMSAQYPDAPIALALALVVAFQSFGSRTQDRDRRDAVRAEMDAALETIAKRIAAADADDGLAFAILGQLYGAPIHYQASFGANPVAWITLIGALERRMVAAGLNLSAAYGGIRSARFQY